MAVYLMFNAYGPAMEIVDSLFSEICNLTTVLPCHRARGCILFLTRGDEV